MNQNALSQHTPMMPQRLFSGANNITVNQSKGRLDPGVPGGD
jgi:hypothetical protein